MLDINELRVLLIKDFLDYYGSNEKFNYMFDNGQFLISLCKASKKGVNKTAIIKLFNEYLEDYNYKNTFLYDISKDSLLIAVKAAVIKVDDNKYIPSLLDY